MLKSLFSGKRKFISIPFALGLFVYFWPFLIGGLLVFFAAKKIRYNVVKYIAIILVLLFSLPIGSAWVLAMTGHASPSQTTKQEIAGESTVANTPTTTNVPTNSPTETPTPTVVPKDTPIPTKVIPTKYVAPTTVPTIAATQVPTQAPVQQSGGYTCDCSKTCTQISSCAEAQYLLNSCGCTARDADHDGIACDSAPLHCQN